MDSEGCTTLEVPGVLQLRDYDLAVRCLEVIRTHLPVILPPGVRYRIDVIALCHHHPANIYPAFGVFGTERWEDVWDAERRINAWVADRGLEWLVAESATVTAPTWASLRRSVAGTDPDPAG
jgi:hypothetical protein